MVLHALTQLHTKSNRLQSFVPLSSLSYSSKVPIAFKLCLFRTHLSLIYQHLSGNLFVHSRQTSTAFRLRHSFPLFLSHILKASHATFKSRLCSTHWSFIPNWIEFSKRTISSQLNIFNFNFDFFFLFLFSLFSIARVKRHHFCIFYFLSVEHESTSLALYKQSIQMYEHTTQKPQCILIWTSRFFFSLSSIFFLFWFYLPSVAIIPLFFFSFLFEIIPRQVRLPCSPM